MLFIKNHRHFQNSLLKAERTSASEVLDFKQMREIMQYGDAGGKRTENVKGKTKVRL